MNCPLPSLTVHRITHIDIKQHLCVKDNISIASNILHNQKQNLFPIKQIIKASGIAYIKCNTHNSVCVETFPHIPILISIWNHFFTARIVTICNNKQTIKPEAYIESEFYIKKDAIVWGQLIVNDEELQKIAVIVNIGELDTQQIYQMNTQQTNKTYYLQYKTYSNQQKSLLKLFPFNLPSATPSLSFSPMYPTQKFILNAYYNMMGNIHALSYIPFYLDLTTHIKTLNTLCNILPSKKHDIFKIAVSPVTSIYKGIYNFYLNIDNNYLKNHTSIFFNGSKNTISSVFTTCLNVIRPVTSSIFLTHLHTPKNTMTSIFTTSISSLTTNTKSIFKLALQPNRTTTTFKAFLHVSHDTIKDIWKKVRISPFGRAYQSCLKVLYSTFNYIQNPLIKLDSYLHNKKINTTYESLLSQRKLITQYSSQLKTKNINTTFTSRKESKNINTYITTIPYTTAFNTYLNTLLPLRSNTISIKGTPNTYTTLFDILFHPLIFFDVSYTFKVYININKTNNFYDISLTSLYSNVLFKAHLTMLNPTQTTINETHNIIFDIIKKTVTPIGPNPDETWEGGYVDTPVYGTHTPSGPESTGYESPNADTWLKNATGFWGTPQPIFDDEDGA